MKSFLCTLAIGIGIAVIVGAIVGNVGKKERRELAAEVDAACRALEGDLVAATQETWDIAPRMRWMHRHNPLTKLCLGPDDEATARGTQSAFEAADRCFATTGDPRCFAGVAQAQRARLVRHRESR